jgi:hypothetical protein
MNSSAASLPPSHLYDRASSVQAFLLQGAVRSDGMEQHSIALARLYCQVLACTFAEANIFTARRRDVGEHLHNIGRQRIKCAFTVPYSIWMVIWMQDAQKSLHRLGFHRHQRSSTNNDRHQTCAAMNGYGWQHVASHPLPLALP